MLHITMNEQDFYCVLRCYGLDADFIDTLKLVPFDNLNILGLSKINPFAFEKEYFKKELKDVSIDPNANVDGISPNNFYMEATKPFFKLLTFYKLHQVGKEMFEDFDLVPLLNGDVYFHDSTKSYVPYCVGASCLDIIQFGRPYGEPRSFPPKRSDSYVALCIEFLMDMSQEFAGAVALTDFLPGLAWFTSKEQLTDKYIENRIQSFVHVANNKFRVGGDSPFSNISVSSESVLKEVFSNYIFPDGRRITDFIDEILKVQRLFLEFMYKGRPDKGGLPYKFPVVTANFKKENLNDKSELNTEWFKTVAKLNHKGFININNSPRFAMCCRLNIDQFKFNSFGGGGLKLGSFRVVNLNLPKLANGCTTLYEFEDNIDKALKYAHKLLNIERVIIKEKIQQGFLKFFNLDWYNLDDMFFGTLSFHGLADAIQILMDKDMTEPWAQNIADIVISYFLKEADSEKEYHINIEQAPSESATNTMAKLNRDNVEYYSNQFVPLDLPINLEDRIQIEGLFSDKITGGSMCFVNLDKEMDEIQSLKLHKYIYENSMINQWCPNYGWTICNDCGNTEIGEIAECVKCKEHNLSHYERVVGYLVNRDVVNKGREKEMLNRVRH